jgi:alanyl-tRNA synthetase
LRTFPESEYHVPFFDENHFTRKRCPSCGEYFWTQRRDQVLCGESPCVEYTFIGSPPTSRSFTLEEMRELFLSFFEENGHKRISPYPVVSRWRDDLFFTDASIVDFQPYVTDGLIPPPANPLVVSQPCMRFVDIDNVGPTFGRHLTIFEMGGAHAFNYPDKCVYWKDQTIRYHHDFMVSRLGVDSEEITYKEDFWSGGGNAGPDVEGIVRGLEVSTLVFMYFKVQDEGLTELPIKTVDTGYGIERYTWLSQGSPSCFHAIYGSTLDSISKIAGVDFDEPLVLACAKRSGAMKLDKAGDLKKARRKMAEDLNVDVERLDAVLTRVENVFAVADHTKSLVFMLAEGVVPSNVREGYLTRLLLRRTYRLLRLLGIEEELPKIVDLQISHWGRDFPRISAMRENILKILEVEKEKYKRALARGSGLVNRLIEEKRRQGISELSTESIIELYDSHGLPPTFVKELAEKEGVRANVPDDFYALVAKRHLKAAPPQETTIEKMLKEKVSDLPATRMLYYEDPYATGFSGRTLRVLDGRYVILDRTLFYPEGGGQPGDRGILAVGDLKIGVQDVQKVGNVIVHLTESDFPTTTGEVRGEIDWKRRETLMRMHTATHLVIGAARRVLGDHAWQSGSQKGLDVSRVDVSHFQRITPDQADEIERLANEAVRRNLKVETRWMPRESAEALYGFRLYQGGVVPGREIRVVKAGDWEVEACGGTHVSNTGEIGLIKIVKTDRIQDGVERITYTAGQPAIEYIQRREGMVRRASEALSSQPEMLEESASRLSSELRSLRKEVGQLSQRLAEMEAQLLLRDAEDLHGVRFVGRVSKGRDVEASIKSLQRLIEENPNLSVVLLIVDEKVNVISMAGAAAVERGVHSGRLAEEAAKTLGGGGGGDPRFGQGGGVSAAKVDEALKRARRVLEEQIGGGRQ